MDVKLKLLSGRPIPFENGLIYSPRLDEIAEIGEDKYNEMLSIIYFEKDNIKLNKDNFLKELTDFESLFIISYHDENFATKVKESFQFFTKELFELRHTSESVLFYFPEKKWCIDNANFGKFQRLIELVTNIKKPDEYKPANRKAIELLEKLKKFPVPRKKEEITLTSIINALAWRNNGININEIFKLTVYQLYQAFFTTENIDNYLFTLQGIYSGTVDGKKINLSKIHWAKEIKD